MLRGRRHKRAADSSLCMSARRWRNPEIARRKKLEGSRSCCVGKSFARQTFDCQAVHASRASSPVCVRGQTSCIRVRSRSRALSFSPSFCEVGQIRPIMEGRHAVIQLRCQQLLGPGQIARLPQHHRCFRDNRLPLVRRLRRRRPLSSGRGGRPCHPRS